MAIKQTLLAALQPPANKPASLVRKGVGLFLSYQVLQQATSLPLMLLEVNVQQLSDALLLLVEYLAIYTLALAPTWGTYRLIAGGMMNRKQSLVVLLAHALPGVFLGQVFLAFRLDDWLSYELLILALLCANLAWGMAALRYWGRLLNKAPSPTAD